ncbi:hypothetical protein NLI92_005107 [Priestia megaterium]|uniref:hypothetical protein n=1 Tax=Priestia megaterium TaxID=1404 RepID=UPI0021AC5135|nr:hypothetical protein [Priestia megaterium]MCR8929625.1 hypothetical protein [Priestia megaterium]
MSITDIKKMLRTLIEYEDSTITHTIPGLVELVYSKASQTFQVTTLADGNASPYSDIDTACHALYIILKSIKKEGL